MINQARTLLLNVSPVNRPPLGSWGEEYIDPSFKPVALSNEAAALQSILFGLSPDNLTLNYRVAQYMAILHADPIAEPYVLGLDSRYTYRNGSGWFNQTFGPEIYNHTGNADLEVLGNWTGNDISGQNQFAFLVSATAPPAGTVTVQQVQPGLPNTIVEAIGASLPGNPIDLPGLTLPKLRVTYTTGGSYSFPASWTVFLNTRPSRTLGCIMDSVLAAGAQVETLAAYGQSAPYDVFLAMFQQGLGYHRRLAGALLTLIYSANELTVE